MPAVIPMVLGGLASWAIGPGLVGTLVGGIVSGIAGQIFAEKPDQGAAAATPFQSSRGALVNVAANDAYIPVIYGFRRTGVLRVFTEVHGTENERITVIEVVSEGPINDVVRVYLDEVQAWPVPLSQFASGGLFSLVRHFGTDDQTVDTYVNGLFPGKWLSTATGVGIAYFHMTLIFSPDAFPSGFPQVTAEIAGREVYDPREGSPSVYAYSQNPALCIRDYLTNTRYGCAIPEAVIDEESFIEAANFCDELVDYPVSGSPSFAQHERYKLDGRIDTGISPLENLNAMLSACRGMLIYSAGRYKLLIDKAETPTTFEFTEDNIVGAWSITLGSKKNRYNRVKANWFNPEKNWEPDLAVYDNAADRSADNGLLLERELELPYTINFHRAQRLAQIEQKQSRFGDMIEFTATIAALQVEVGDVVPITHSTPHYEGKLFRILKMEMLNTDEVRVTARAYSAAVYTTDSLTVEDLAAGNALPDPFANLSIGSVTATSGTADLLLNGDGTVVPRIRLTWPAMANQFIVHFEVQFAQSNVSPTAWTDVPPVLGATATEAFVLPVTDGVAYDVRIRPRNTLGVAGTWVYVLGHTVIGKTAPPSDVTGFSAQQNGANVNFRWDQVSDDDLAGYEIRYNDEGVTDWASAQVVTAVTRGTAITNGFVPPGSWELLIKALDTSGNPSTNAASYSITVTNALTVIGELDEAPLWVGEKENLVLHWTGVLVPDSQSTVLDLSGDIFDVCVPDPYPTCTYTAPEIDIGFDDSARAWGDIISTVAPGDDEPDDPQLQLDYRAEAAAYDGFENWTIGFATGRYFQHRFTFTTANGILIFTGFRPTVDAEESGRHAEGIVVDAGGTTITFTPNFHNVPNLQVTAQGAAGSPSEARFAYYENLTAAGARIHVTNPAGTSLGGTANWSATGV